MLRNGFGLSCPLSHADGGEPYPVEYWRPASVNYLGAVHHFAANLMTISCDNARAEHAQRVKIAKMRLQLACELLDVGRKIPPTDGADIRDCQRAVSFDRQRVVFYWAHIAPVRTFGDDVVTASFFEFEHVEIFGRLLGLVVSEVVSGHVFVWSTGGHPYNAIMHFIPLTFSSAPTAYAR